MALKPLISIIGTTGVGKSRLAIDLALAMSNHGHEHGWHTAKVINSDSMQVYSGADVITNKVPESERRNVEHLLMSFKEPGEQYVVGQWVNDAIKEIDELHRHKILPVVVGGTAYWMQHLIFPNRLTSFDDPHKVMGQPGHVAAPRHSVALQKALSSLPGPLLDLFLNLPSNPDPGQAFALHTLLSMLDPHVASRWHWKDTRKVLRNLEIISEKGLLASELLIQQAQCADTPRYPTLIFWLFSNPDILHKRLDARVHDMIQEGLLNDVRLLQRTALSGSPHIDVSDIDTTSGIFQAIGFKEFINYLSAQSPSQKQYDEAVERTKVSTRQFARRQVQWIRNKLLPAVNSANKSGVKTPVFLLNVTDLDKWDVEVRDVAARIAHGFLEGRDLPDPRSLSLTADSMLNIQAETPSPHAILDARRKVICDVCTTNPEQPMMVEDGQEWNDHMQSRRHRRMRRVRIHPKALQHNREARACTNCLDSEGDLALTFPCLTET
ncbi:IPP transferase-domain-containing protein [Gautieria morchelliformis]|nr:IPP transferase-domain-containing protein [Gautieria morchelliformis]